MEIYRPEERLVYLDEVLEILNWSRSKYNSFNKQTGMKWREELKSAGIIHEQLQGSPPQKRLMAFPSDVRNWMRLKSARGQRI